MKLNYKKYLVYNLDLNNFIKKGIKLEEIILSIKNGVDSVNQIKRISSTIIEIIIDEKITEADPQDIVLLQIEILLNDLYKELKDQKLINSSEEYFNNIIWKIN